MDNGEVFVGDGVIHQDCSSCTVPHHRNYVQKNFNLDWKKVMIKCNLNK